MTTVDVPIDAIAERAQAMRPRIDWRRLLIFVVTIVPFLIGKGAGVIVSGVLYGVAAFAEGYATTRPTKGAQRRPRGA